MHLDLYQRVWIVSFIHVCLLATMLYLHVCLSIFRLCHALCAPWVCACRSLRPLTCVVASVPLVARLDVTACETQLRDVGALDTHLSLLRAMMLCLPCLLCATCLAFFASLHLCTLAYIFMHESLLTSLHLVQVHTRL